MKNFINFFREGFASMTIGRTLWLIVIIKLFIMFCILKPVFFPNQLKKAYETEEERSEHVARELTKRASPGQ